MFVRWMLCALTMPVWAAPVDFARDLQLLGFDHTRRGDSQGRGRMTMFVRWMLDALTMPVWAAPVDFGRDLHLLGFDHTRLTYNHMGRKFRLTDVHGEVIRKVVGG